MAITCGVCNEADSKYKCPTCELRYCSIKCYKPHKAQHEAEAQLNPQTATGNAPPKQDRPGTTQRTSKPDLSVLASDPEFKRLLTRYPTLHSQLGAMYGLTLDPGPSEARTWSRQPLPSLDRAQHSSFRGRGRGRGARGGGRGGRGGFHVEEPEERQRGMWTREKGDKEALSVMKKMRSGKADDDRAEGVREFVRLVDMRFGSGAERR
jgi:hypothetical protein